MLESFHSQIVPYFISLLYLTFRFLAIYLPLRAKNPETRPTLPLDTVAKVANVFIGRAAGARGETFLEWDADDVVGICVSLIDQVRLL